MTLAIRAQGLSKRYRIGDGLASYETLRESITRLAKAPFVRLMGRGSRQQTIWALDDVSFQVKRGEVLGIIGRNGAGKSTLLRLLGRITEPTRGRAEVWGRVGSLLEVGTGFHPELTGGENVFLNGAILGMKRREIVAKFDAIVSFAEVEKFIDTPVKHYSSGMYLRLAFSVAAHLEPEILLVDEVLAVGDASFQKRCLGKMGEVSQEGRTVLFVSHNIGAVTELCHRALLLEHGKLAAEGPASDVVARYVKSTQELDPQTVPSGPLDMPTLVARVEGVDEPTTTIAFDLGFKLVAGCQVAEALDGLELNCILYDVRGAKVFHRRSHTRDQGLDCLEPGRYEVQASIPPLWLAAGAYTAVMLFRLPGGTRWDLISSPHLPLTVTGAPSRFGCQLVPREEWEISQA